MDTKIKIGDILEIPLLDNKKTFAHYIYKSKIYIDLIQVHNYIVDSEIEFNPEDFSHSKPLFPPLFTSLKRAIKICRWKIVGNIPVENSIKASFVSTLYSKSGNAGNWFLYNFTANDEGSINIGKVLPEKYKHLEYLAIYSPENIVKRISTGVKPFEKLINTNSLFN
jgi:hypothetical protein